MKIHQPEESWYNCINTTDTNKHNDKETICPKIQYFGAFNYLIIQSKYVLRTLEHFFKMFTVL